MARPAPSDLNFAPTFAVSFSGTNGGSDADLTAQGAGEFQFPASSVLISNTDEAAEQNIVVRLQGAPTTDVTMVIAAGGIVELRAAFTTYRTTSNAAIRATFFWQSGPA